MAATKVPMLHLQTARVAAAAAAGLKVEVFCKDATELVRLGMFNLPAVEEAIVIGPKGAFPCIALLAHVRRVRRLHRSRPDDQ